MVCLFVKNDNFDLISGSIPTFVMVQKGCTFDKCF